MSKAGEIPYSWKQIEDQVREAILCQASILEAFGPSWHDGRLVAEYLGLDLETYQEFTLEEISQKGLDISRHRIFDLAKLAYDYAYQLDGAQSDLASEWHDVDGMLQGFPRTDAMGEPSPFNPLSEEPLRRMLETFFARFGLFGADGASPIDMAPSVRELALLANMTVPAVRTSLSKEGFKLEKVYDRQDDTAFKLNVEDAKRWLSRRRGFIPQRSADTATQISEITSQLLTDKAANFADLLSRLLDLREISAEQLAAQIDVDQGQLSALLAGESAKLDIDALCRLARALDLSAPEFTAAAVRHLVAMMPG